MTYQEKREWLLRYRRQRQRILDLGCELKEMQALMKQQREEFSHGKSDWKCSQQEKEARIVQERELLLAKEERALMEVNDAIESALDRLEDTQQRRVLRMVYIGGKSQEQICEESHYCKRHVGRLHIDGVNSLQLRPEELRAGLGVGKSART